MEFPSASCELRHLDFSHNEILNPEEFITVLQMYTNLISLNVKGTLFAKDKNYRKFLFTRVPQIEILDNIGRGTRFNVFEVFDKNKNLISKFPPQDEQNGYISDDDDIEEINKKT